MFESSLSPNTGTYIPTKSHPFQSSRDCHSSICKWPGLWVAWRMPVRCAVYIGSHSVAYFALTHAWILNTYTGICTTTKSHPFHRRSSKIYLDSKFCKVPDMIYDITWVFSSVVWRVAPMMMLRRACILNVLLNIQSSSLTPNTGTCTTTKSHPCPQEHSRNCQLSTLCT